MYGQVRALFDDDRKRVDEAGLSIPVQVLFLIYIFQMAFIISAVHNFLLLVHEKTSHHSHTVFIIYVSFLEFCLIFYWSH